MQLGTRTFSTLQRSLLEADATVLANFEHPACVLLLCSSPPCPGRHWKHRSSGVLVASARAEIPVGMQLTNALPPVFQLREEWKEGRDGGDKKYPHQSLRPTSAAPRIEGAPRPPQSALNPGSASSKPPHDRPQSARRFRPSERLLAGADPAVRWPSLRIDDAADGIKSGVATVGEESDVSTNISDVDEFHAQSEVMRTPSGPLGACNALERRNSIQSSSIQSSQEFSRVHSLAATSGGDDEVHPSVALREPELSALEGAIDQDKAVYAEKYCAEGKFVVEGDARTIRRRFFSDLKGCTEPRSFEIVLANREPDSSSRDYLTWYYCDFLESNAPVGPAPPFHDDRTTSADELLAWLNEFKPRTRADAYPMLQVAVSAIHKIVSKEVKMRNGQAETLIRLNWDLEKKVEARNEIIAELRTQKERLERDIEDINAGMARVQKEADSAAEIAQKEEGQKMTLVELFKTMQTELKEERERNEKLNTAAVANKQLAEEAAARIVKLEAEALSRKRQTERLQKYAKTKELEKNTLEKQVSDNRMAHIFAKVAQMSLSSYVRVWSHLAVKHRGRRLQTMHTLTVLARRKARMQEQSAFRGWCDQLLQARKVDKVRSVIRKHTYDHILGRWCYNLKMSKVASMLYQAGRMEEGKKEDLLRACCRGWKSNVRYLRRLRKAMRILQSGNEGRTLREFLLDWRAISAANLLQKAGFGSQSKDKGRPGSIRRTRSKDALAQRGGGIRRSGSSDALVQRGAGIQRTGSVDSSRPSPKAGSSKAALTGSSESSGQPRVGRTGSPGMSRVASFESICESDDDENNAFGGVTQNPLHYSSGSPEPAFGRLGSTVSNASAASGRSASSFGRTSSSLTAGGNFRRGLKASSKELISASPLAPMPAGGQQACAGRGNVAQHGEEVTVAQQAVDQEAFLSTLLRGGSSLFEK